MCVFITPPPNHPLLAAPQDLLLKNVNRYVKQMQREGRGEVPALLPPSYALPADYGLFVEECRWVGGGRGGRVGEGGVQVGGRRPGGGLFGRWVGEKRVQVGRGSSVQEELCVAHRMWTGRAG